MKFTSENPFYETNVILVLNSFLYEYHTNKYKV